MKNDFPFLQRMANGHPFCYVDNAAMAQMPQQVIDAMSDFYAQGLANVHRSTCTLGEEATSQFEQAREAVAAFISARTACEIIFTSGTTDGINLVAHAWGSAHIGLGDEIVVTKQEHHSNLLPWQRISAQVGATLRYIPVLPDGMLDMKAAQALISSKTKLLAVTATSNAIGVHNDLPALIARARAVGARVLVDGAQSVAHQKTDVIALDADFFVFSGYKLMAPTGIGILYVRRELHEQMMPYKLGGGMVHEVLEKSATFLALPHRLEAGTPPIAQAIGLHAALNYIQKNIDFDQLKKHESALCAQLIDGLLLYDRVRILGNVHQLRQFGHMVSFVVEGIHAHDVAAYLDSFGICVRAGHHCAQPLARALKYDASTRISFYAYNTVADVERIIDAIGQLLR